MIKEGYLNKNLFTRDTSEIAGAEALLTVIGGQIVYKR
jgi:hypothetical protein